MLPLGIDPRARRFFASGWVVAIGEPSRASWSPVAFVDSTDPLPGMLAGGSKAMAVSALRNDTRSSDNAVRQRIATQRSSICFIERRAGALGRLAVGLWRDLLAACGMSLNLMKCGVGGVVCFLSG